MGEFSDDDDDADFANFDLNAAVIASHSAKSSLSSSGNNRPLKHDASSSSSVNDDAGSANKRPKMTTKMTTAEDNQAAQEPQPQQQEVDLPTFDHSDNEMIIPDQFKDAMTNAMQMHFGHSMFRSGQLTVLYSILNGDTSTTRSPKQCGGGGGGGGGGKDTCVFWATGAGKSLCYQLPPLYLNQVAVVVSPLISLMEDRK